MIASNDIIHYKTKGARLLGKSTGKTKVMKLKSDLNDLAKDKVGKVKGPLDLKQSTENRIQGNELPKKDALNSASKSLLSGSSTALKSALSIMKAPVVPLSVIDDIVSPPNEILKKISNKEGDTSSIFFIEGLDLNFFNDDKAGLKSLSQFTEGSRHDSWTDENDILMSIKRLKENTPLVIIGHSLGGDAAVSIANRLNTPEYGFKKIDLLVTLDSVGMDNDIIPENVKWNKNFISDTDYLFNDGPNIARNHRLSKVENILKNKQHTEIDSDPEIQADIMKSIIQINQDLP